MNAVPVFRVLGVTMMFIAFSMLVPLLLALSQDDYVSRRAFFAAFCVSGFFGVLLLNLYKDYDSKRLVEIYNNIVLD